MDATIQEEAAASARLLLIYSFSAKSPAALHGMHLLGAGDVDLAQIESLVKVRVHCAAPVLTYLIYFTYRKGRNTHSRYILR